jgi:hypothetical protein
LPSIIAKRGAKFALVASSRGLRLGFDSLTGNYVDLARFKQQGDPSSFETCSMRQAMKRFAGRLRRFAAEPVLQEMMNARMAESKERRVPDAGTQISLLLTYRAMAQEGKRLPKISEIGFSCYSQTDEDGILLYLFALLGFTNKLCVEVCAGDGIECNSANLILNHGWHGLLVDGDPENVEIGRQFYSTSRRTYVYPPRVRQAWITRENVNAMLREEGFSGPIELLSVDLDGVDYWIWEAITEVDPRVVVVEYQDILGPDRCWTIPYSESFRASDYSMSNGSPNYGGASLGAFTKLAQRKGYRLVGTNTYGYNAFFVKEGLAEDLLPRIEVRDCFHHPKVVDGMRDRFPLTKDLKWVEV